MQSSASRRGVLITLEGPDGAGKSVQASRLVEALRAGGDTVSSTREPGGTDFGESIRELLLLKSAGGRTVRADALLFNAARAALVETVIEPALKRGEVVVCDRFSDSTLAYQGYAGGLAVEGLALVCDWATDGLRPDLTLLLDLPAEVGLGRRAAGSAHGRNRYEEEEQHDQHFHERVRQGFLALAAREAERWRVIDATGSPDRIASEALRLVHAFLAGRRERSELIRPAMRING